MDQFSANNGYAYIETGLSACFSSEAITVEIKFGESEPAMVNVSRDKLMQTTFVERVVAEDFLRRVLEAAHKPEVLAGARMTTWHHANLRWKNLSLEAYAPFGQASFKANELPAAELQELLPSLKGQDAERLRSLLQQGIHCRAIEIHRIVSEFTTAVTYMRRSDSV